MLIKTVVDSAVDFYQVRLTFTFSKASFDIKLNNTIGCSCGQQHKWKKKKTVKL